MAYGKIDPKLEYAGRRMNEAVTFLIRSEIAPLLDKILELHVRIDALERERGTPSVSAKPNTEKETAD